MVDANVPQKPKGAEDLEKQGIDGLIRSLRDSPDPQVRQYAAYLLGKTKSPRAIQPLIEGLQDFDKSVREQVVLALSAIGKAAIEPLSAAMKEEKWQTRYRAAEALGKIADEKVVKPLIAALKDNRDHVRYMAAKGLKDIRDSDAIEPLAVLLKDENEYVRKMAVIGLGVIGGDKAMAALAKALETEKNEKVKKAIEEAMK